MGYGFFNAGIMTMAPKGKALRRRAHGKKGQKGKRSKPRDRWDITRPMVATAKGEGQGGLPLIQVLPQAGHLKAYIAGLAMV